MSSLYDDSKVMAGLANLPCKSFVSYAGVFEALASQSVDEEEKRIYNNLYSVCILSYGHEEEPYTPFFVPADARPTFSVTNEQYEILANVVDEITDVKLKARVSDILWLGAKQAGKKGGFKYAKLAVESFARIPIDDKLWIAENIRGDWERGLKLAKALGKGAINTYDAMKVIIRDAYVEACRQGGVENQLTWGIPEILDNDDLCDVISPVTIAKEAESLLVSCATDHTFDVYCDISRNWYYRAGLEDDAIRVLKLKINRLFGTLISEVTTNRPQWLKLTMLSGPIVQLLQSIPSKYRANYEVEDKIMFLKQLSTLCCKLGRKQMTYSRSDSVDITKQVNDSMALIKGCAHNEVLPLFAAMFALREEDAEQIANIERNNCIVPHITGKSVIKGNRIVAQASAYNSLGVGGEDDEEGDGRLWLEKIQKASFLIQEGYYTRLKPAYDVIRARHSFSAEDFLSFVEQSPLAPLNHARNLVEGLSLGYDGRFTAASYLLVPELENIIREQLKSNGYDTTVLDSSSKLENEVGLSALLEKYSGELAGMFSRDFVFELHAIFCDHAGPNMRNEIAHGLRDDEDFNGIVDFYVWWFMIRLLSMRERVHNDT